MSTAEIACAARSTAAELARAQDSQNAANERDADSATNLQARNSLDGNEDTAREALSRAISIDEAKLDAFTNNHPAMQDVEDISNAIAAGDDGKQNAMLNLLSGYENDASITRESHRSTVIKIYSTVEANTLKTMNDQSALHRNCCQLRSRPKKRRRPNIEPTVRWNLTTIRSSIWAPKPIL